MADLKEDTLMLIPATHVYTLLEVMVGVDKDSEEGEAAIEVGKILGVKYDVDGSGYLTQLSPGRKKLFKRFEDEETPVRVPTSR